jgi:hypothetical protein
VLPDVKGFFYPGTENWFEKQYRDALVIAKQLDCLDFLKHYDYFVLAYPERKNLLRIKRLILHFFRKKR